MSTAPINPWKEKIRFFSEYASTSRIGTNRREVDDELAFELSNSGLRRVREILMSFCWSCCAGQEPSESFEHAEHHAEIFF